MTTGDAQAYPGSILSLTDHELYVVSAHDGVHANGQIATWILPGTLAADRQRVVAVLSPQNYTHRFIMASGRFALSMLAAGQHALVPLFGLVSGRDIDKFDGLKLEYTPSGIPVLADACGWMECSVLASMDAGDRIIHLADVTAQRIHPGRTPLRKAAAFAAQPEDIRVLLEQKHRRDGQRDIALLRTEF